MPEHLVDGAWRVDLGNVNAYLLETEAGPVTVDAGMPGTVDDLREAMRSVDLDPETLQGVLVTHTDLDHVGGLAELVEGTQARVHLSPVAARLLTGELKPPWLSTKGLFQRVTSPWLDPPPDDRLVEIRDGERVHGFMAVETPGHALGHTVFVDAERGLCLIGDLVRTEKEHPSIPPRFINYDTQRIRSSLRHLLDVAPTIEIVCAGHGEPVRADARNELERLLDHR